MIKHTLRNRFSRIALTRLLRASIEIYIKMKSKKDQTNEDIRARIDYLQFYQDVASRFYKDPYSVTQDEIERLKPEHSILFRNSLQNINASKMKSEMDMEWISLEHEQRRMKQRHEISIFRLALTPCFFFVIGILIA